MAVELKLNHSKTCKAQSLCERFGVFEQLSRLLGDAAGRRPAGDRVFAQPFVADAPKDNAVFCQYRKSDTTARQVFLNDRWNPVKGESRKSPSRFGGSAGNDIPLGRRQPLLFTADRFYNDRIGDIIEVAIIPQSIAFWGRNAELSGQLAEADLIVGKIERLFFWDAHAADLLEAFTGVGLGQHAEGHRADRQQSRDVAPFGLFRAQFI